MLVLKGVPAPGGEPALPQALLIVLAIFDQSLDRATIAGIGPYYAFLSYSNDSLPVYHVQQYGTRRNANKDLVADGARKRSQQHLGY